jgi:hypothetical protein
MVYAGTYNENLSIPAGTVGNYRTIKANPSDTCSLVGFGNASPSCGVTITSVTMGSHTKLDGVKVTNGNTASCVGVGSSTDVYITSNYLTECAQYAHDGIISISTGSYVYVQGNTLSWSNGSPQTGTLHGHAITIANGNHILVEQNDFSHYVLGISFSATFSVFRNNTFHDQLESESGEHSDIVFAEPSSGSTPAHDAVVEGNRQRNAVGPNAKSVLAQAENCAGNCYHMIVRFNDIAHTGGGTVTDDNAYVSTNPGFHHVKTYNNTFVDVDNTGSPSSASASNYFYYSTYAADVNNIYYWPGTLPVLNAYASDATTSSTFYYGHNLAYCGGGSCSGLMGHIYNQGAFLSDPGNVVGDPKFLSYAGNDFHLQSGSPAISAGTYLTSVAAGDSGSGASLVVNDATYFQDGYGLVNADWIRVGASTVAQIASIDYATNTITLAGGVSRSVGDSVYLYKNSIGTVVLNGALPDIGAYQYSAGGGSALGGKLVLGGKISGK